MSTPPTQLGPYRIVRPLGQGAMGVVYEAIQEPIERRVALKVLLPQHAQDKDTLSRFFNEARAVNMIEHPSIVQVSDYGQTAEGTAYLVMEFLRGETLDSRLDKLHTAAQRMPWVEAAQLAAQLADALTAAHDKSIVHRDLKPGNVMLVRDPAVPGGERAKILDFGIAKLTQGQARGTATNALIGTPQYMSPEQCRGAGGVDGKTDVYALGVILYEILAGRPPFLGDNTVEYMGQHVFKEPPSLYEFAPQAHAPLVALIQRLLVKDKAARPAMREVGIELSRLVARESGAKPVLTSAALVDSDETRVGGGRPSPLSTLSGSLGQSLKPGSRMRLKIVGAAAAAVLVGGLGVLFWWHPTGSQKGPAASSGQTGPLPVPATRMPAAPLAGAVVPPAAAPLPADSPPGGKTPAALPLETKPAPSTAKPPAARRSVTPVTLQAPAGESTKASKPAAKVRPVADSSPPGKPTLGAGPAHPQPKPTTPPVKRPIRYED